VARRARGVGSNPRGAKALRDGALLVGQQRRRIAGTADIHQRCPVGSTDACRFFRRPTARPTGLVISSTARGRCAWALAIDTTFGGVANAVPVSGLKHCSLTFLPLREGRAAGPFIRRPGSRCRRPRNGDNLAHRRTATSHLGEMLRRPDRDRRRTANAASDPQSRIFQRALTEIEAVSCATQYFLSPAASLGLAVNGRLDNLSARGVSCPNLG
jgi:hypothetical protein